MMKKGMICAPQPEAVEAGSLVLSAGGNAVDAAIACALVQTVVDPQMCGIAGFGSMQIFFKDIDEHMFIDFHGRAPLASSEEMWAHLIEKETEDGFGFVLKGRVNDVGYGSITTPMSLKAFDTAIKKFGTMSLEELFEPAINFAENGFMVRPHVNYFWNQIEGAGRVAHIERVAKFPATKKIYVKSDGTIRKPGEILKNKDMANTYRQIAEKGIDDFYLGEIANTIAADMKSNGGLLTLEDLKNVSVSEVAPLFGSYRGFSIATNQPPGGGIMILQMLNILENFDLVKMRHNSAEYIATISEAMKISTVDKDRYIGDPNFVDVPVDRLISKEYAKDMAKKIKSGYKTRVPRLRVAGESQNTTHVCSVDREGNMVSLTHSLGMPSGVVTDGLGFMYNGCMCVFDPRPGRTGSIQPGKSRFTAMCPTIVFKENKPVLIIGAPGGTYITMGVLQGILNTLDFGMDADRAVTAPRICTTSDIIDVTNRIPRFIERELCEMGYEVRRSAMSYFFAGVHAISFTRDGDVLGGADPGRDGMAMMG